MFYRIIFRVFLFLMLDILGVEWKVGYNYLK